MGTFEPIGQSTPTLRQKKEANALETTQQKILDGHLPLLNYALQFGYSYNIWKHIVNTMLEKEQGVPKLHRLRVIHLYKADYNLILGVKWWQVLHHASLQGYLNEGCYGSQPGKEASGKATLHFDNDATSCYNMIPCFLANLASRKYGMHRKICKVQGKTLKEAKYFLKTKFGISEDFIQHSKAHPMFGTGQGSSNSPTYWLFISSTLFDMYDEQANGSTYESPNKWVQVKVKAIGFVDDVQTSVNAFANNALTINQLVTLATRDSQLWHDILTASNQALELPKCGYHAIMYNFVPTGEPAQINNLPSQVILRDVFGHNLNIKQWSNKTAVKYLGALKCPADQKQQYQALKRKCDNLGQIIQCSHLTHAETRCFCWAIYRLSAIYVLPTSYFAKKELDKIQAQAHGAVIS